MAYDEGLAQRIREVLADRQDVAEKKMFGGIAFMVAGNMSVGIVGEELMVRVGPDGHADALNQPHARPMDFTGRAMKGFVYGDIIGGMFGLDLRAGGARPWVGAEGEPKTRAHSNGRLWCVVRVVVADKVGA